MWYEGGQPWSHSRLVCIRSVVSTSRLAEKASQIMKTIIITPTIEIIDPIEETRFQIV